MKKTLFVAGTWDSKDGKESGLMKKMYYLLKQDYDIDYFNGGNYEQLKTIIASAKKYDIIFWLANINNDLEKLENIKNVNPLALVIGSKRNHYEEYSFVDILNKSLIKRHNLTIEFSRSDEKKFKMLLFDPLGTVWYDGFEIKDLVENMKNRINFILTTKRERTFKADGPVDIPNHEEFFQYTRDVANIFHETINHADGVTRFLGNASFKMNNRIYVSRRDVDKALINKENFVESFSKDNKVYYYGDYKPSKDTVVQIKLYKLFPEINYIVHSHCYADGAAFTKTPVPCGSLDEIDEILYVIKNEYNNEFNLSYYKFNLKGHGTLIMAKTIDELKQTKFITRNIPEKL